MKKKVKLLNNLERKYFEEIYQCLKDYPLWDMENIFNGKTPERDEFKTFPLRFYVRDKNTRLSVAAHEAGHAIVAAATYKFIDEVVIDGKDHPEGWLGWVTSSPRNARRDNDGDSPVKLNIGMPPKPIIIIDILIDAAGFVGESLIGKKTGANHEKFLIYCRCRHLDDLDGVVQLTNWTHYVEWCRKIILNNDKLFWKVIDDLLTNSSLTDTIKTLLNNTTEKEPIELFF